MSARGGTAAGLGVVFALLVVPAILAGQETMLQHGDMTKFHLPQVNQHMKAPLSWFDYDATSATTPGHHFFLAYSALLFGYDQVDEDTLLVRFANAGVGLAFVLLAFFVLARLGGGAGLAAGLVAPILGSNYVLSSSIWVMTDNGANLWFTACLWTLLFRPSSALRAGVFGAAMVLWRQIYLPVAGAFALSALWARFERGRLVAGMMGLAVPTLVVGAYAVHWGGLTPGTTQLYNEATLNLSVPLHALALTGLFACAYAVLLWPMARALDRRQLGMVGACAAAGLVVWLLAPSTFDADAGRWGSMVWLFAKKSPAVMDRSLALLPMAVLGAAVLGTMFATSVKDRVFPAELVVLLLYFVGYSAQVFAWQRYIESPIVLALGVFVARRADRLPAWGLVGPVAVGVLFATLCQLRVWGVLGSVLS